MYNDSYQCDCTVIKSNRRLTSDSILWYLATMKAYRAYNDSSMLDYATTGWVATTKLLITPENAASGIHAAKNVTFNGTCQGESTAGGLFLFADNVEAASTNTAVHGSTLGAYLALSAYLFEATGDQKYSTAAELSAQFIKSHLSTGTYVFDRISLSNCQVDKTVWTYSVGYFLEGLSVHANTTGNATWTAYLNDLVSTSIQYPGWTRSDGVITEGFFIRGLFEVWKRTTNPQIASLVNSYITVQLNALMDLAKAPTGNYFSPSWPGPSSDAFNPLGQLAALNVLNAGIATATKLNPDTVGSSKRGVIIGLVIALCISALIVILSVVICLRRRKRARAAKVTLPSPFDIHSPHIEGHSEEQPFISPSPWIQPFTARAPNPEKSERRPGEKGSNNRDSANIPLLQSGSRPNDFTPGHSPTPSMSSNARNSMVTVAEGSGSSPNRRISVHDGPEVANRGSSNLQTPLPNVNPNPNPNGNGNENADDPSVIPDLLERLNRAIANLPQGGIPEREGEEPPEYFAV
ncbi:hypothetical protein NLI96_g7246 [Meripilus lineatus]|uniref:Glycoside hydrolase family 76 protein n=1 Tax=Meripilus lineatus TaxID=2056292 RepID=A0AAD5UZI0_9APHY|nr:hypothetical protein NLI96_g7246 [Physisporinus lineatus]